MFYALWHYGRTYVCLKIKEFYDRENGVFFHGGRKEVKKSCDRANIVASMERIKRYAREMRDQDRAATDAPPGLEYRAFSLHRLDLATRLLLLATSY